MAKMYFFFLGKYAEGEGRKKTGEATTINSAETECRPVLL